MGNGHAERLPEKGDVGEGGWNFSEKNEAEVCVLQFIEENHS